jgi:hypothetical protein
MQDRTVPFAPSSLSFFLTQPTSRGQEVQSQAGYSLTVPDTVHAAPSGVNPNEIFLYTDEAQIEQAEGSVVVPPSHSINYINKAPSLPLDEFVTVFQNGWYGAYATAQDRLVAGHRAIVFNDQDADIPRSPLFAAFIDLGDAVLLVTSDNEEGSFDLLLNNIEL